MNKLFLFILFSTICGSAISQEIYLRESTVDYGKVKKGSNPIRKFKITNKGDKPLKIKSCKGSCYCITPTCPRGDIAPGKSAEISIKYDTKRVGQISKTITIMTNDPKRNAVVVKVRGQIEE